MTAFPGHFSYKPRPCERYLGRNNWCQEDFETGFGLKNHRKTCVWSCSEVGCQKKGATRKREIDKHERGHEAERQKLARISQFMIEP